jgi:hypothetical protein
MGMPMFLSLQVIMDFPHPRLIFSTFSFTQFFRSTYIWLFHVSGLIERSTLECLIPSRLSLRPP